MPIPRRIIATLIAGVAAAHCRAAVPLELVNHEEIHGAAYARILSMPAKVDTTLAYCVDIRAVSVSDAEALTTAWRAKNHKYLALAPILRAEIRTAMISEGDEAKWRKFDEKMVPELLEWSRTDLTGLIQRLPEGKRKEACDSTLAAIASGTFDVNSGLQVAEFFRQRVSGHAHHKKN